MNVLISKSGTKSTILDENFLPIHDEDSYIIKYTSYGCLVFKIHDGVIILQDFVKVYSSTIQ